MWDLATALLSGRPGCALAFLSPAEQDHEEAFPSPPLLQCREEY
jgi:hypothetical protein